MAETVIGKYIRLSQEDRELGRGKDESCSIGHQRDLIERYIREHREFDGCVCREFLDDGYSGTSFSRPSFDRMMDQVRAGEISCIIVKDFSRFGRDYIELGDYMERIFPFLGVRFISVNDGYDSDDYKGTTGGLEVVMKNIVYDYYSRDLSVKVKTAKMQKMKKGLYIGGHVPFGLRKDPRVKGKLEIDGEAAAVVREIFDCALDGMRLVDIARKLNKEGRETPAAYYRRMHPDSKKYAGTSEYSCWDVNNVRKILTQEMYYGAVASHKREAVTVGGKHTRAVPKEEQVIVEGMHPAIVTKEEFERVQAGFRKAKKPSGERKPYPLKGRVVCGCCGLNMRHAWNNVRGRWHYGYWKCGRKVYFPDAECVKYLRDTALEMAVWEAVKGMICLTERAGKRLEALVREQKRGNVSLAKELAKLQKDLEKCSSEKFANVDGFMAGKIRKDAYLQRRAELTERAGSLEKQIRETEDRLKEMEIGKDTEISEALDVLKGFSGETELTVEMAEALVKKVTVFGKDRFEIEWNFSESVYQFITEA